MGRKETGEKRRERKQKGKGKRTTGARSGTDQGKKVRRNEEPQGTRTEEMKEWRNKGINRKSMLKKKREKGPEQQGNTKKEKETQTNDRIMWRLARKKRTLHRGDVRAVLRGLAKSRRAHRAETRDRIASRDLHLNQTTRQQFYASPASSDFFCSRWHGSISRSRRSRTQ